MKLSLKFESSIARSSGSQMSSSLHADFDYIYLFLYRQTLQNLLVMFFAGLPTLHLCNLLIFSMSSILCSLGDMCHLYNHWLVTYQYFHHVEMQRYTRYYFCMFFLHLNNIVPAQLQ